MAALRPSVVYLDGLYRIIGPVSRRTLYAHTDKARVYAVRDLFVQFAPDLLDPEDGEPPVLLNEFDPFTFA
ncbi:MAG: hypothetical protein ACXVHL_35865 [Solirubrobacteraceae bacterium]